MKKKLISALLTGSLMFGSLAAVLPVATYAANDPNSVLIEGKDIPLHLQYDEEAPYGNEDMSACPGSSLDYIDKFVDDGWERWSIPLGNGYFGVNAFGRTDTERLQITEKTLVNPYSSWNTSLGGLNNFSETYLDFGHPFKDVTNYKRALDLKTATSTVNYNYQGTDYSREYFVSYPDKCIVIKLDASEAGKLNFTLRPTIPYEQDYAKNPGDGVTKHGEVISKVNNGIGEIELKGKMGFYDIDFVGLYRVFTDGGNVEAATTVNKDGDTDGTIKVSGAKSAYIVVTVGSDFELTEDQFTTGEKEKPTFKTGYKEAFAKVNGEMNAVLAKIDGKNFADAYNTLRKAHTDDFGSMFNRVKIDISAKDEDIALMTDDLLHNYQAGQLSTYLEALYFQYGRYLLISSSRKGTLPANLQGTWNRYNFSPWSAGYWHNVNIQMNYWPAFSTNIAETFDAYIGYNKAYMKQAEINASNVIAGINPSESGKDGGDGWCIGTGGKPNNIGSDKSPGNLGFTTQLFFELYSYTKDEKTLREVVYPVLASAARFITKCVKPDGEGHYLVQDCDSPEQHVNGIWYHTKGTAYAQSFAYQNNYNLLLAAKDMGIDFNDEKILAQSDYKILKTVIDQLDKYDPIIVGLSGQIKEFREENYYGDLGEYKHRHISQLVGLYPGNIINGTTPAWLDAAKYSLTERGDIATGWGVAHRLNLWARTKDGDRTYMLLKQLLKKNTATNLWDLHPPFQIDGNLGGTAGISEMLLQSHEGYIDPLAAIPHDWNTGYYTGLVARGNFEVSAKWTDGLADTFNITSKVGGECRVHYQGIEHANLMRADGRAVHYEVVGKDLISFKTSKDQTYIISNFDKQLKPDRISQVNVNRNKLEDIHVDWAKSNAPLYNVYIAVDSAPSYTLIGTTADTKFTYTPDEMHKNSRFTFAITAVGADGTESDRALGYSNPYDASPDILEYEANVTPSNDLQVVVRTSAATKNYKLWYKASGAKDYTLVAQTPAPILIINNYDNMGTYAISAVSDYLDAESEKVEINKFNVGVSADTLGKPEWSNNVLEGYKFVPTAEALKFVNGVMGYDRLTDGKHRVNGDHTTYRFGTKDVPYSIVDATVTFDERTSLDELRIYDYNASTSTSRLGHEVHVYGIIDGKEVLIKEFLSKDEIHQNRGKDEKLGTYYLKVDCANIEVDGLRVVCKSTDGEKEGITIFEIECSGTTVAKTEISVGNILSGKLFTGDKDYIKDDKNKRYYGYDKLTDGDYGVHTGRFAIYDNADPEVTLECDLDAVCTLDKLTIYDHGDNGRTRSTQTKIEVCYNGVWTTIYENVSLNTGRKKDTSNGREYTVWDMGGVKADKIRIHAKNTENKNGISIYEILCSGTVTMENPKTNAFEGITNITHNGGVVHPDYPMTNAFDGDINTRYAVSDSNPNYYVELDLGRNRVLYNISIYDFRNNSDKVGGKPATRSNETYIEVFKDGKWIRLIDKQPLVTDSDHTVFNLNGAIASKVRIGFNNTQKFDNGTRPAASIFEIKCTTINEIPDRTELRDAYLDLPTIDIEKLPEHKATVEKFEEYVRAFGLTEKEVKQYAKEMREFTAKFKGSENATLDAFNITLDGKIGINFRYVITADFIKANPDAYVQFTSPNGEIGKIFFRDMKTDEEGRYIVTVYVAVAEMADKVKLVTFYKDGVIGEEAEYSVKDYAQRIKEDPTIEKEHPGVTNLLNSMLNMGGYAQIVFGYHTNNLANKGLYELGSDPVMTQKIEETATVNVNGYVNGLQVIGFKLSLESESALRYYFIKDEKANLQDYTFTVILPDGTRKEVTPVMQDGRVRIDVENINAREISKNFKVEVKKGNQALTVEASALSYVGSVLSNNGSKADLVNLVKAIKIYSVVADKYNFE